MQAIPLQPVLWLNQGQPITRHRNSKKRSQRHSALLAVVSGLALYGCIHLLCLANIEHSTELRDPVFYDKSMSLTQSRRAAPGDATHLVMLGSSRTLLGFHANYAEEVFHNETGKALEAFNFGIPATGPIYHWLCYQRLRALNLLPDVLFVEVLPSMLHDPGTPLEVQFLPAERLNTQEFQHLQQFGYPIWHTNRNYWQQRVNPVWECRFSILARISPSWLPWNLRYDWGRNTDSHGWATPPRQQITAEERIEREAQVQQEYASTLATLQPQGKPLAALQDIIACCRADGVQVMLVLMPEAESFQAMYPAGLQSVIEAQLNQLGVPIVNARDWLMEDDFYDGHHPFERGARKFTERLIRHPMAATK